MLRNLSRFVLVALRRVLPGVSQRFHETCDLL
jgi:hypothetical protein